MLFPVHMCVNLVMHTVHVKGADVPPLLQKTLGSQVESKSSKIPQQVVIKMNGPTRGRAELIVSERMVGR